jgi:bifunctional DNA-binding transcriptional regulator/antitoxin component of YhaV-PrlF toxin-antitoxin module
MDLQEDFVMVATDSKSKTVHVLRGGQVTIPIEFRRELGLDEASLVEFRLTNGMLTLQPVETKPKGSEWLHDVYEAFEPVRREIREKGMTEEEVDALINEAFQDVRAELYGNRES